jgi:hypothetical protein
MTQTIQLPIESSAVDNSGPACKNAAVKLCCNAWETAFNAESAHGKSEYFARKPADRAYRDAMPTLSGRQGICDFIACVAHGMIMGVFDEARGTKLLYAAQVAQSTFKTQPKTQQIGVS